MFLSRILFATISLICAGSPPFCEIFSGDYLKGCLCVKSNISGRNLFFYKILGKVSGKSAKMFSDFSQRNSPRMSKMLSACPVHRKSWGVVFGERVFFKHFWTFRKKKFEHFSKSVLGNVVKLGFTCLKQQIVRFYRWKKETFLSFKDNEQKKFQTVQQNFPRALSNLLSNCPMEQFRGKSQFFSSMILRN